MFSKRLMFSNLKLLASRKKQFFSQRKECFFESIFAERFGVEYQPIVEIKSQEIRAFEALARFYDRQGGVLSTQQVYNQLHETPRLLFEVEYRQKKLQIGNFPGDLDLFLNLDQDSYFACNPAGALDNKQNPFLVLFGGKRRKNIVAEIIENSEINHARMSLAMIEELSRDCFRTAIDDVLDPASMLSTEVVQLVDFIKFDRHVVTSKKNQNLVRLVRAIIDYARDMKKEIILEGIETEEDLCFARFLNVDCVQGYLYKDRFVNWR